MCQALHIISLTAPCGEMVEGATGRLEMNPSLQRHSKGGPPFRGHTA